MSDFKAGLNLRQARSFFIQDFFRNVIMKNARRAFHFFMSSVLGVSSLSCSMGFQVVAGGPGSSPRAAELSLDFPRSQAKTYGQIHLQGKCESGAELSVSENDQLHGSHVCHNGAYSIPLSLVSSDGSVSLSVKQTAADGLETSREVTVRKIEHCSLDSAALEPAPFITLNPNTMPVKTGPPGFSWSNPQGDGSYMFGFNALTLQEVNFPVDGYYAFRVQAKYYSSFTTPPDNPYPKLQIAVNGRVVAEADVSSVNFADYNSNDPQYEIEAFKIPAGNHLVSIGAGNWSKEVNQNNYQLLFVNDIEIYEANHACAETADAVDLSSMEFADLGSSRNLRFGTVLDTGIHIGSENLNVFKDDPLYPDVLRRFNHVQPGSVFLLDRIATAEGSFDFTAADEVVDFAVQNGMTITLGHLVWHHFIPNWLIVKNDSTFTRAFLEEYITTVITRYKGKIKNYIVVNEALDDDEGFRQSFWYQQYEDLLGPGQGARYIKDAFEWARAADPDAVLIYNEYDIDELGRKSDAALSLISDLLADSVPVDVIGLQGHLDTDTPQFYKSTVANMNRFANLGLKVHVTEFDVGFFDNGAPSSRDLEVQRQYYRNGLRACLAVSACEVFTVFGTADKYWWGPLLSPPLHYGSVMNDDYSRKPAYEQLIKTLYGLDPWE